MLAPLKSDLHPRLRVKLARVRLFLCDVDGVLTDGSIWVGEKVELKRFNIQDGLGLTALRGQGIRVGWISSRPSSATTRRATELKVDFLRQEKGSKVAVVESVLAEAGCSWEELCYAGDDLVDLGVMERAGAAVAVVNAVPEVKARAHYVTINHGGKGAVREICELILKAQRRWEAVVKERSAA